MLLEFLALFVFFFGVSDVFGVFGGCWVWLGMLLDLGLGLVVVVVVAVVVVVTV